MLREKAAPWWDLGTPGGESGHHKVMGLRGPEIDRTERQGRHVCGALGIGLCVGQVQHLHRAALFSLNTTLLAGDLRKECLRKAGRGGFKGSVGGGGASAGAGGGVRLRRNLRGPTPAACQRVCTCE